MTNATFEIIDRPERPHVDFVCRRCQATQQVLSTTDISGFILDVRTLFSENASAERGYGH